MPTYPGGETALFQYIADSLKYPQEAIETGIVGIVMTSFIILEDGSVGSVKVEQGIGAGCDEAAIAVIENMPNWVPARKGGRAVKVQYMMPIQFDLQEVNPNKRKKKRKN
jgi:protein TonB